MQRNFASFLVIMRGFFTRSSFRMTFKKHALRPVSQSAQFVLYLLYEVHPPVLVAQLCGRDTPMNSTPNMTPEELAQALHEANRRIAELEAQVLQAQKMETVGFLAGGVAHHYTSLLTAIIGYVDISLLQLPPDHEVTDYLHQIKEVSSRAADLTRQLLAFARKQKPQPKIVSLNTLIRDAQSLLQHLITSAVILELKLAPDLNEVRVDAGQFEQLLVNLVVNARDAMLDGGVITIETENMVVAEPLAGEQATILPGTYVVLKVTDTGIGIPDEVRANIFEPFFTTKSASQGTGLGLPTSLSIVRQHEGYIVLKSEPDAGTTFEVYLPAV